MFENFTSSYTLRLSVLSPARIERSCSKLKTRLQKLGTKQNVTTVLCNLGVSKIDIGDNVCTNKVMTNADCKWNELQACRFHNYAAIPSVPFPEQWNFQWKCNCARFQKNIVVVERESEGIVLWKNVYKPAALGNGDISLFALEVIWCLDSFVCWWVGHVFQLYLPE